uniref:Uncharacterized protein n=1 Tax=Nomascus leucogenys TaxID=61853 RepID=A0A2I3GJN2_NOMLE
MTNFLEEPRQERKGEPSFALPTGYAWAIHSARLTLKLFCHSPVK